MGTVGAVNSCKGRRRTGEKINVVAHDASLLALVLALLLALLLALRLALLLALAMVDGYLVVVVGCPR